MSDLFVLLACAGGVVLVAVLAHGVWQARRAGVRRAEPRRAAARPDDPVEPILDGLPTGVSAPAAAASGRGTPQSGSAPEPDLAALRARAPRTQSGGLDALIDAIVAIAIDAPVAGEQVVAALPATHRAGTKPVYFEGLAVQTGRWEPPQPRRQYRELQAGVQLANRTGALGEIEFSEFIVAVQAFADAIGGTCIAPDMLETVARARELDAFANDHDAQIRVQLVAARTAWSPAYLAQQAAAFGFVPGAIPGRLVVPGTAPGDPPMLVLEYDVQAAMAEDPDMTPVRQATLVFDVPQTDRAAAPFARLRDTALELSKKVDAAVVDNQGMRLGKEAFDTIGATLDGLYERLQAHGLAAGSAVARRLFS